MHLRKVKKLLSSIHSLVLIFNCFFFLHKCCSLFKILIMLILCLGKMRILIDIPYSIYLINFLNEWMQTNIFSVCIGNTLTCRRTTGFFNKNYIQKSHSNLTYHGGGTML